MDKIIATILSVVLLLPAAALGVNVYETGTASVSEEFEYSESTAQLDNPYCGWYKMYGYRLNNEGVSAFDSNTDKYIADSDDVQLIMLEININNFRNSSLSENALEQLEHLLTVWGDAGHNLILRFLYDWDGNAMQTEPDSIDTVKLHMSQTAEVVNRHTSSVYIMQGIFVGNFAEMNSSNYMDEAQMTELANYLDSVISDRIYLAVRTPQQLRIIRGTATLPDVASTVSGSSSFRTGLFNDGMLGSSIDVGTYGSSDMTFSESDYSSKGNRTQELQYQNTLCLMVPNGGEVVLDNPYNDIGNAATDLATMHVSYLNSAHDMSVINKWKRQTYTGSDAFNGMTAYDYITRHLGYRYVLRNAQISVKPALNNATLTLSIENAGFAPTYRQFNVTLSTQLTDTEGNTTVTSTDVTSQTNVRTWYPDQTTDVTLTTPVELTDTIASATFYLKVTDATTGRQISFANELSSTTYGYELGTVTIPQ